MEEIIRMFIHKNPPPYRIKVLSRKEEKIEVEISAPVRPEICDQCGLMGGLSENPFTGVVVCMTTGCGKDFGYSTKVKKVTMKISDFKKK